MTEHIIKNLVHLNAISCDEIVLHKNKSLHLKASLETTTILYCICGASIIHVLDSSLRIVDTLPLVSGETYVLPDNAKAFLVESLNASDQDLKFLKIVTRNT
jgi:hypothetical protein